tara:strand:- start:13 stop:351 length:339 start_codon:yes stop_codon:yes gene_type:complete
MKLNEDKLNNVTVDLNQLKAERLNESFLATFGFLVKNIMKRMFGDTSVPSFNIKGNHSDVTAFTRAISGEKRYMDALKQYGLDDPRTFRTQSELKNAINSFERTTGLRWPFE